MTIINLEEIKKGNTTALKQLHDFYFDRLCFYARKILIANRSGEAQDIANRSIMKFWMRRSEFTTIQMANNFLYTCTRNACIDFLRKTKKETAFYQELSYLTGNDYAFIQISWVKADMLNQIYIAIENLPPQCRCVFKMYYLQKMRAGEIAQHQNISVSSVKAHIARALELLRNRIINPGFETYYDLQLHSL